MRNLRHTGATLALQEGTNPVLVAFRLGHAYSEVLEALVSDAPTDTTQLSALATQTGLPEQLVQRRTEAVAAG